MGQQPELLEIWLVQGHEDDPRVLKKACGILVHGELVRVEALTLNLLMEVVSSIWLISSDEAQLETILVLVSPV